jgi:lipopolysaccharide/colanic/teichoic acid biosynthesis glycosyltransferase
MGLHLPSSRAAFSVRLSMLDSFWAILTPILALHLRDAPALSYAGLFSTFAYCSLSMIFSLIAFSAFRIHSGLTRYFSVLDAIDVTKAVATAAFTTYVAVFTLTRLEGIPRTTPIIHALILLAGLTGFRIFTRLFEAKRTAPTPCGDVAAERILMIGSNHLSLLYIKFIRAYSPGLHQILAVLDDRPEMIGRAIDGVRVIGPVHHLEAVVKEFAEHGVNISQVIVGGDPDFVSDDGLTEIRQICGEHEIHLSFVPQLVGLHDLQPAKPQVAVAIPITALKMPAPIRPYFMFKRYFELAVTVSILLLLSPLWLMIGTLALWDVGSPIFFWQQRLGEGGRQFLLYKIRTLKPLYDWRGCQLPDAERLSAVGRFLRKYRFDEIPQLLNVLIGDMSLIGPRPLLPRDQPKNPAVRLSVRPGITGWAQINGGKDLSAEEKNALDEWYVRNVSLSLDLWILLMTLKYVFQGERRSEMVIADARSARSQQAFARPGERLLGPAGVMGAVSFVGDPAG